MRIIEPSFHIYSPLDKETGISFLRKIENFARISHRSEELQTDNSWIRFIPAVVLQHGDWSVVEHASASVVFRVDRGVTHEIVRHRLFSFTQESTRFVNGRKCYPEGLEFICPAEKWEEESHSSSLWRETLQEIEDKYFRLLEMGWRPQEARSILPNALAATIAVVGNLRNWRHFLLMRTTKETHSDFKRITIPLLDEFKNRIPFLFDDITPEERQIDAERKPR